MTKWTKFKIWLKAQCGATHLDLIFVALFLIFLLTYTLVWNEIDLTGVNINRDFIAFWASLFTITGLLFTIHRQLTIEGKLEIHNKAIVQTNIRICQGLIDDILAISGNENTDFRSINLLRERIEVHLHYCQKCCTKEQEKMYLSKAKSLSRWESELRMKTKSKDNPFDMDKFINYLRTLKRFLIKEDQLSFKM